MSVLSYCSNEDSSAFGVVRVGSLTAYEFSGPNQVSLKARIGASNIRFASISGSPISFIAIARDDENVENMYIEVLEIKASRPISNGHLTVNKSTVVGLKLYEGHLLIIHHNQIEVYALTNLKKICSIETMEGSFPLCAYDFSGAHRIAYAEPKKTGHVSVFDLRTRQPIYTFKAHNHGLVAMNYSPNGKYLATASTRGTIARVFNLSNLQIDSPPVTAYRRGHVSASVNFLLVQPPFLCVSSDRETIHFFQLHSQKQTQLESDSEVSSLYSATECDRYPFFIRLPPTPSFAPRFLGMLGESDLDNEYSKRDFWICDHTATARCFSVPNKVVKTQTVSKLEEVHSVSL
ncbi:hypothetical protein GEMRC1_004299 [Eukaryota sp. GEM-RC1]